MALPDKLHKRSEFDYVLYDEADNRITHNGYDHWYNGKSEGAQTMATYVIGDLHGALDEFHRLLKKTGCTPL